MFVPWAGTPLQDIRCEQYERTVGNNNCVKFDALTLQIPADKYRFHYVKVIWGNFRKWAFYLHFLDLYILFKEFCCFIL